MTGRDQAIQSIGIATLNYGYRFKFRFFDNECGELLFHGAVVGSVFDILRGNFRPRVTWTLERELRDKFGCVPHSFGFLTSMNVQLGIHKIGISMVWHAGKLWLSLHHSQFVLSFMPVSTKQIG